MRNIFPQLPTPYSAPIPAEDLPVSPIPDSHVFAFPATLPLELALGDSGAEEICAAYDPPITRERFEEFCAIPAFQKAYEDALVSLSKEGMSFKVKARFMSEELLKTAWDLIHNRYTQSNVKADLIKSLWRVAGFEPKANEAVPITPIQINVNL